MIAMQMNTVKTTGMQVSVSVRREGQVRNKLAQGEVSSKGRRQARQSVVWDTSYQ